MNSIEIKCARVRKGLSQEEVAKELNMKAPTYRSKENGRGGFSDADKVKLAKLLGWDYSQMNEYLYDGVLPDMSKAV
ncbi:MAG: helix-turn-helix domain-containing protein [Clostridia bacterium]|nr:helix-turn-helix domain-containing protein [Clostridia bacterium]